MKKILKLCLLSCSVVAFMPSYAGDIDFSGYASVVAGMTMDKGETFLNDDIGGGSYTDELEFAPESLFALQAKMDLSEGLSATTQIVARGAADYNANFEWAYLSYKLNPDWTVQAGRKGDVFYKYSDYRDVGYSYNQMRLPTTMYAAPFNSYDGLNVLHKTKIGSLYSLLNVYYGNVQTNDPFNSLALGVSVDMSINDLHGVVWDISQDWWEARLGFHRGSIQITGDFAAADLSTGDVSFSKTSLTGSASDFLYITGAFGFELGNFSGIFEASDYSDEDGSGFNNSLSYFSNFAYNIGDYTPSISYSNFQESAVSAAVAATMGSELEGTNEVASTYTALNLKYDFHAQATFKASYAMQSDDSDTAGAAGGDADILSFGVDFVF